MATIRHMHIACYIMHLLVIRVGGFSLPSVLAKVSNPADHGLTLLLSPQGTVGCMHRNVQMLLMETQSWTLESLTPAGITAAYGKLDKNCSNVEDLPSGPANSKMPRMLLHFACPHIPVNDTLALVLKALSQTVKRCPGHVQTGLFSRQNTLLQLMLEKGSHRMEYESVFLGDEYVQLSHSALVMRQGHGLQSVIVSRQNFAKGKLIRTFVKNFDSIYSLPPISLSALRVTMQGMMYPGFFMEKEGQYSGTFVDLLKVICDVIGAVCNAELVSWDDNWSGVALGSDRITAFPPQSYFFGKALMFSPWYTSDNSLFASPRPRPYWPPTAMLDPLEPSVWILAAITALASTFCLSLMAKLEATITGLPLSKMALFGDAIWYTFATLLGENIWGTTNKNTKNLPVLSQFKLSRLAISCWLLFVLVLSSGYAGNLRAFMAIPSMDPPLDTMRSVVDSQYMYDFVPQGIEVMMKQSTNPDVVAFLKGKVNIAMNEHGPVLSVVERLEEVANKRRVASLYKTDLDTVVSLASSSGSGHLLIHVSPEVAEFPTYRMVLSYPKMNSWSHEFDRVLGMVIQSNLYDKILFKNRLAMKRAQTQNNNTLPSPIFGELEDRKVAKGLSLGNFVGSAVPVTSVLATAMITFFTEITCCKKKKTGTRRD